LHKVASLVERPGPLGFVEQCDMVGGWGRTAEALVAVVVNVLNEGLHLSPRRFDGDFLPFSPYFVARQGLLQAFHEWSVAREEDAVGAGVGVGRLRGDIETDERFAASGNSRDEADRFLRVAPSVFDNLKNCIRGACEFLARC